MNASKRALGVHLTTGHSDLEPIKSFNTLVSGDCYGIHKIVNDPGRVPVVLSDHWVPPDGPNWAKFAVRIPERQAALIPHILAEHESRWQEMAREARAAWEEWFAPDVKFHRMVESCADILQSRSLPETIAQRLPQPTYIEHRARAAIRPLVKRVRR